MSILEKINAEIANLGEDNLKELHELIKSFVAEKNHACKPGIMAKLKEIKIEGPSDFSANLDQYLSGEKRVGPDLH
jgi:hypothetical protein